MAGVWTDEAITFAAEQWAGGRSADEIAALLPGKTRSAVLGKLFRLGLLNNRQHRDNHKRRLVRKPNGAKVMAARQCRSDGRPLAVIDQPNPPERTAPAKAVAFQDLGDSQCRFPFGTGPYAFCGCQALPGQAYCAEHHSVAYTTKEQRAATATRAGEREKINLKIAAARRILLEGVQ